MELMLGAGWEIPVYLKDLYVLFHATLLFHLSVVKEKFSVTTDRMEDVPWEITVCQKDLSVLFLAIVLQLLPVLMEKFSVTMDQMEVAG